MSATSIAENAGSSLTITATLSGATDENVTVGIDTAGTATEGTDYTDGSGNLDDITSAGQQQVLFPLRLVMTLVILFMKKMKQLLFLLDLFLEVVQQKVDRSQLL